MPSKHWRYGGSTAKRTLNCPGWRQAADKVPKIHRSNEHAVRGTALHQCLDECVMGATNADEYVGRKVLVEGETEPYEVTADDVEDMNIALDAAYRVMDKYGITEVITEQEVQVSDLIGGSADVLGRGDVWSLTLDWKLGYTPVVAEQNPQAIFYVWNASMTPEVADMFEGMRHVVAIVQPKVGNDADVYELEQGEMEEFALDFIEAVNIAEGPNPPKQAGDWCGYCPAAPYCEVKRAEAERFLAMDPKQSEDLAAAMAMVEAMKDHIKTVEAEVFAALEQDQKVPGYKLVMKQARRYWINDEEIEIALRKARIPVGVFMSQSLLSVAQLEKALKNSKREFDLTPYFSNTSSGTTIAPESDKRPAVPGKSQMPDNLAALMNKG